MKKAIKLFMLIMTLTVVTVLFTFGTHAATVDSTAGRVSVTSGNLNIRKSASTSAEILKTAKNKSYLTLISKTGSWWKVEYAKSKYGYCHADYITKLSSYGTSVNITSGSLNVRSKAGTSYSVKDTLSKDTVVVVLSESDGWSRILYNGAKTGYVSSAYLKRSSYKPISLKVASYKQTDSRWSDVPIGTQGGTVGSIGCTTTCLAMTESYRTGTAITPKAMAGKLSYSASGSLYWPTGYATELVSSSNALSRIYSLLSQGKPVIYGLKKSGSSTQHWVVITGYNGSSTSLSASSFTVNDPGSNSRTTLKQVMSIYPTPYKIAYAK